MSRGRAVCTVPPPHPRASRPGDAYSHQSTLSPRSYARRKRPDQAMAPPCSARHPGHHQEDDQREQDDGQQRGGEEVAGTGLHESLRS